MISRRPRLNVYKGAVFGAAVAENVQNPCHFGAQVGPGLTDKREKLRNLTEKAPGRPKSSTEKCRKMHLECIKICVCNRGKNHADLRKRSKKRHGKIIFAKDVARIRENIAKHGLNQTEVCKKTEYLHLSLWISRRSRCADSPNMWISEGFARDCGILWWINLWTMWIVPEKPTKTSFDNAYLQEILHIQTRAIKQSEIAVDVGRGILLYYMLEKHG